MNVFQILVILGFAATVCMADSHENKTMTCPDEKECREQSGATAKDFLKAGLGALGELFSDGSNTTCTRMKAYKECMDSEWDDCKVASGLLKAVEILDSKCDAPTIVISAVALVFSLLLSKLGPHL